MENSQHYVEEITKMLDSLSDNTELPNTVINSFLSLNNILSQFPDQITDNIKSLLLNLASNQIDLLLNGNIKPNPNLLNVLDLSFSFSL